jgi:hypothetical protein
VTREGSDVTTQATVPAGIVQPATLAKAYNVDSNVGSAAATQCVFSSVNQYFSPVSAATPSLPCITPHCDAALYDLCDLSLSLPIPALCTCIPQRDLETFQRNNLQPLQPVTTVIGGGDVDSVCASNANNCVEVRPSPVYQLSEPIH